MNNEKKLTKIATILQEFKKGNYETPIEVEGVGEYYEILNDLETIRGNMLVLQNRESEITEKNKSTLANITHDMKTPLALISGYAESLQCGMDDKDYLDLILKKTAYLNELVLKIISTSKKEIEDIAVLKEKTDAESFFTKEIAKYKNLAETKKIKIEIDNIPKVKIFIDQKEYVSVVQNLMTNAIKYGNRNGKIKVKFKVKDNYLQIKVRDNGIGIAKENLPYIFDKFYMVDSARTSANSGLGLSIVKKIIEENGGTIKCRSKLNSFTEFIFTIPIYKDGLDNDKLMETLPKIEDKLFIAIKKINSKNIANVFKKTILIFITSMYLLCGLIVQTVVGLLLSGLWLLDTALLLGSFANFLFMGIVIANGALIPIILMFFGMSIFCLGFFFVLSSEIMQITYKLIMVITEMAKHMLHITNKVYGGAQ